MDHNDFIQRHIQEEEHVHRRPLNDDPNDDFVAIDFETMTSKRTSACALGMVKVIDGVIMQKFYTLINPIRDIHTDKQPNRPIHGISLSSVEKTFSFKEIFEGIKMFINGYPIVCHNKGFDISVLNSMMDFYGLEGIDTTNVICTYSMTGLSISECCERFGIPEINHHDALWDAEVCARIYLELLGKPIIETKCGFYSSEDSFGDHKLNKKYRTKLDEDEVTDKSTIFYNSKVVITGVFETYSRNELGELIQKLGAKINQSISTQTNIVIVGESAGPRKMEKITELKDAGIDIRIIREQELLSILNREL